MCVDVCAGAGAGAGGTQSSGMVAGPGRPHDRHFGKPKIVCLVPDEEDLALKQKINHRFRSFVCNPNLPLLILASRNVFGYPPF